MGRRMRACRVSGWAALAAALLAPSADAGVVFGTGEQTVSGNVVNANATFSVSNQTLTIRLDNLETGTLVLDQLLSEIYFTTTLSGTLALTKVEGKTVTFDSNGKNPVTSAESASGAGTLLGWSLLTTKDNGGGYRLTAHNGSPFEHFVVGNTSTVAPEVANHNPSFVSATFTFSDTAIDPSTSITTASFDNMTAGFGATTDNQASFETARLSPNPPPPTVVPEPRSSLLFGFGLVALIGLRRRAAANLVPAWA